MTTSSAANKASTTAGATGWLGLAASPTFALMAWLAANDVPSHAFCAPGAGILPIGAMTAMYVLMSVFHLAPWLKLASSHT